MKGVYILPIEYDNDRYHTRYWHGIAPVMNNKVTRSDLERDQCCLENEEIPPGSETEGLVDVAAGEADERRRDGQIGDHLSHAHGDGEDESTPL